MPAAAPKNAHARTTVGILATVRMVGLVVFIGLIALTGLATLVTALTEDQHLTYLLSGVALVLVQAVFAALWYAGISWLTETLNMLTQIARNTSA
jgi:hypothetical protein